MDVNQTLGITSHNRSSMQSPIPQGSVLRDRYIIRKVIGQGGMGRTYVAEDTERFNEICVLKEFIPLSQSPDIASKAKELFLREASTLYQIRHPQVPEFRATFEANGRLFLVQDYVEGRSYRELLSERRRGGQLFTEAEVVTLLKQVLPILIYLHDREIIHRDISPENLMLRSTDRKPVLIDFGVVKEAATQLQSHLGLPQSTVAGKPGYAPPEQLQTGHAYASSDLYALAVTVVVLLTGKEPQDLFDRDNLSWQWQRFASVSPDLAKILNRMLNYKPAQRFSSAEEVLDALEGAPLSEIKTVAVGRQPTSEVLAGLSEKTVYAPSAPRSPRPKKSKSPASNQSGQGGGIDIFLGALLVLISGIASWAIASAIFERSKPSTPTPRAIDNNSSPTTPAIAPTPTTPSEPSLTNVNKSLNFNDPNRAAVTDKVSAGQSITYRFNAKKGQKMTASLTGSGLQMTLNFEDQKPIDSRSSNIRVGYWQGKLPASGAYFVVIKTTQGVPESNFNLEIQLEDAPNPTPTPTPTATASPSPTPTETPTTPPSPNSSSPDSKPQVISRNVEFPPGTFVTSVNDSVGPGRVIRYRVGVLDGQTFGVRVAEGNVRVEIFDPSGNQIGDISGGGQQQIPDARAGNYKIRVTSDSESSFRLDVLAK
ncbi:serine/threonine-protein kinase [Pseudanabaena sp. PCC 6802]|uniref:serine/threonine-protein kinase n=1 Tax=Pseudanabaena sp. PCC 6802 TaxID=118173 RepID=UPI0003485CBB|nr:serine/threonine-protein kinase [Pseudanabaena sp. PCC 6802]